jgi:hypothetical protein
MCKLALFSARVGNNLTRCARMNCTIPRITNSPAKSFMVAQGWGCARNPSQVSTRNKDAGGHKGLVKRPRIFLALPHSTTLAPNEFSNRRGESRSSGRLHPRRSVGTRGGCGAGWGPCACPGEWRFRQGFLLTHWSSSPGRGQAQGPVIHPTQPLVPTGRLTSLAAFGWQHSSEFDGLFFG